MRSVDRLRAWELRRHHPSVGYRPRIPRAAARPAARISLAQVAQAGALSAPRIEVLGEAAVDHRPGIQVSVWALAAGADIEKHLATTLMPALQRDPAARDVWRRDDDRSVVVGALHKQRPRELRAVDAVGPEHEVGPPAWIIKGPPGRKYG